MAIQQVDGSAVTASSTNNNTGKILNGGTVVGTRFESVALGGVAITGTGPQQVTGVQKIQSGGSFAVMTAGAYVIRKITTTLAGVANTTLQSGASDFGRNSIHRSRAAYYSFLSGLSWSADADGQPTYTLTVSNGNTAFATDDAAVPSLAVPGELVYMVGITPTTDEYSAKTN